jgi:hypothetical protein
VINIRGESNQTKEKKEGRRKTSPPLSNEIQGSKSFNFPDAFFDFNEQLCPRMRIYYL